MSAFESANELAKIWIVSYVFPSLSLAAAARALNPPPAHSSSPQGNATIGNPVVPFEIGCRDSQKTQDLDSSLAAGRSRRPDRPPGHGITGHITALGPDPLHYTIFCVEVDDVEAYLDKAAKLGGRTLVPPVPIPTGTEGNTVGLWKPAAK